MAIVYNNTIGCKHCLDLLKLENKSCSQQGGKDGDSLQQYHRLQTQPESPEVRKNSLLFNLGNYFLFGKQVLPIGRTNLPLVNITCSWHTFCLSVQTCVFPTKK